MEWFLVRHHKIQMNQAVFFGFSILFAISLWSLVLRSRRRNLPPGPLNFPLLGCIPLLGDLPHISLLNLSKRYGDIMYLKLGTVPLVVVSSARAAAELYKNRGSELASNRPLLAVGKHFSFDYNGFALVEHSPGWKLQRRIVSNHLLSNSRLKAYGRDIQEEMLSMVESIQGENGKSFKLIEKLHEMNMNIAMRLFLYGESSSNDSLKKALVDGIRLAGLVNLGDVIPALKPFDLQGLQKQYRRIAASIEEALLAALQERRSRNPASSIKPPPLIDSLISLDSTPDRISDRSKLGMLSELLFGAVDTSAVTIEWGMTELFRHPDILEKARREIHDVVGDERLVDTSDLSKLPLIQAIAKETLRLHAPAPLALPKAVLGGSTTLGGYTIPEKSWVYVNYHAIGVDEECWEEALEFKPQRFLEGAARYVDVFGQDFCLLPFGSGKRICPGAKLGFDVLALGIATLIQRFEWEAEEDSLNMGVTYGLVCSKSKSLVTFAKPIFFPR